MKHFDSKSSTMRCPLQDLSLLLHGVSPFLISFIALATVSSEEKLLTFMFVMATRHLRALIRQLCADPRTGNIPTQLIEEPLSYDDLDEGHHDDDSPPHMDDEHDDPYRMRENSGPIRGKSGLTQDNTELRDWALEMLGRRETAVANVASDSEEVKGSDVRRDSSTTLVDPDLSVEDEKGLDPTEGKEDKLKAEDEEVDATERLRRIEEEFGPWTGPGKETWLEQMPATLYRNVLVKGVLALTDKRLLYLAYLPHFEKGKILKSGFVTVQTTGRGPFARKLKRWAELRSDSLTGYRSSSSLYKPTMSVSLSAIRSIAPIDPQNPKIIRFRFTDGHICEVGLDTVEAADAWHKEWVGALFSFRAKSDRLRAAIPLRRILNMQVSISEGLARVMELRVDTEECDCAVQSIIEGEDSTSRDVVFAYLLALHDPFYERLEHRIELAKIDETQRDIKLIPEPMLEVGQCPEAAITAAEEEKESDPAQEDVDLPEIAKRFVEKFRPRVRSKGPLQ